MTFLPGSGGQAVLALAQGDLHLYDTKRSKDTFSSTVPVQTNTVEMDGNAPINHLAQAVQDKKPVPEIDFTLHTMEDGNQVSTQERVCKGIVQQSNSWKCCY